MTLLSFEVIVLFTVKIFIEKEQSGVEVVEFL